MDFDGTDDYSCLADPGTTNLPTGAITYGAWIYPDSVTGNHTIIEWGERSGTVAGSRFSTTGDELVFTTFSKADYITTTFTIVTGEWQYVSAAWNGTTSTTFYHYRLYFSSLSCTSLLYRNA